MTEKIDEAQREFLKALELKPDSAEIHKHIADVFLREGRAADAIVHYRAAVRLQPRAALLRSNLAWLLATVPDDRLRDGAEAVLLAKESCNLTTNPDSAQLDALAAANAELGDFEAATEAASQALERANATGDRALSEQIEQRLNLYRQHQPYRQPAKRNAADR